MIPQPELIRPAERYEEVTCYDTRFRPVRPGGLSRVREVDPNLLNRQTGDCPPGDLIRVSLKEGWD